MGQTKRFTIEGGMNGTDDFDAAPDSGLGPEVEAAEEPDVTLETIKAAVAGIVRDDLSNWEPPEGMVSKAAAPSADDGGDLTDEIFSELGEIQKHIATTRQEIAALKPEEGAQSQFSTAKTELQEIVDATARATNDILREAEKVSEISATLSEKLTDEQLEALGEDLGGLENAGTQIMLACGFQDLTGQRINKVVNTLIFVEEKVNKLVELWKIEEGTGKSELSAVREDDKRPDADLLNGPQSEGEGISQDDIDAMFA